MILNPDRETMDNNMMGKLRMESQMAQMVGGEQCDHFGINFNGNQLVEYGGKAVSTLKTCIYEARDCDRDAFSCEDYELLHGFGCRMRNKSHFRKERCNYDW